MNIFLFDLDLDKNAKFFYERDRVRFNKQIVESCQLLAASFKKFNNIELLKSDGTPYTVNRILYHPACKWGLESIENHYWHIRYVKALLKYAPNHSCNGSINRALYDFNWDKLNYVEIATPKNYLCITNSDMSDLPDNAPVTDKYKKHLKNKHLGV